MPEQPASQVPVQTGRLREVLQWLAVPLAVAVQCPWRAPVAILVAAVPQRAVMQALEASGQATNTLVLFMSDNGSDPFSSTDSRMLEQGKLPGDPHSNWQHGMGWAYASNTPWRLYKISQHGGGVITGGIAWWPGHTGKPGRIANSPVHMVDVLPTFLAAAGQPPANLKVAGESFLPLIRGEIWQRKNPLYFQFVDNRAIRDGDWTLADVDGQGWELFHTSVDPFENNNLATKEPQRLAEFDARWLKWWETESGQTGYAPPPEKTEGHAYSAQGDRGSGTAYKPSAMPDNLARRYPISARP